MGQATLHDLGDRGQDACELRDEPSLGLSHCGLGARHRLRWLGLCQTLQQPDDSGIWILERDTEPTAGDTADRQRHLHVLNGAIDVEREVQDRWRAGLYEAQLARVDLDEHTRDAEIFYHTGDRGPRAQCDQRRKIDGQTLKAPPFTPGAR